MPVFTSTPITVFDQESFHAVDKTVTGIAFDVHNEFGRYLDERIYQAELAARFRATGIDVTREMKITLTLDGFTKDYFVDFLVNAGVIVETKTVETLSPVHKAQVLNYLFLCGLHHATLPNLRPGRVQHEFVSTRLTPAGRHRVAWDTAHWQPLSPACEPMRDTLCRALQEWGAHLDPALYRDALTHFLGGEAAVVRDVAIRSEHGILGLQKAHHLTDDVLFSVTSSRSRSNLVREHHRRFLQHTDLKAIQWANLNHGSITLQTITRT